MAKYPNGRNYRHKRPRRPDRDEVVFSLLRLMRGRRTCDIANGTFLAPSTISKLRTRRTRYPQHQTVVAILRSLGYRYAVVPADDGLVGGTRTTREATHVTH